MANSLPTQPKVVIYPIGFDFTAGALHVYGKSASKTLVLCCAGFPDDHSAFASLASRLASECDCLVGVACLPGFDDRPPDRPWTSFKRDGYSNDDMVEGLREATKVLRAESDRGDDTKLVGIYHDFGVVTGLMTANRALKEGDSSKYAVPDQIVLFDVALPLNRRVKDVPDAPSQSNTTTAYNSFVTWAYRFIMAGAYLLQRYVSTYVAQLFVGIAFLPMGILKLTPTRQIDAKTFVERKPPLDATRLMYTSYIYYTLFKDIIAGKMYGFSMPDLTKIPVLYMYGLDKNIMFHPDQTILQLKREEERSGKSYAVAVEGAGHWLHLQKPDVCFEEIKKFANL